MPESKFQVGKRFRDYFTSFKPQEIVNKANILYFIGWIFSFTIIFYTEYFRYNWIFIFYIIYIYFWYKLVGNFYNKFRPPNELLLALFLLILFLETVFLQSFYNTSSFFTFEIQAPGILANFVQILLQSLLILIFSLFLVQNSQGKKGVIISFILLGGIGVSVFNTSSVFYLFIFQIILFIYLLRKTPWLEELTKIECWIYLLVVFYLFRGFANHNPFQEVQPGQFESALLWYSLPKFLYLSFQIYLLALLVKIPIVLIYNFARLERKLKISSLFQSTFPQFVQLCMLLLIFYFFIAGWQADKMRQALINQIEQISTGKAARSVNVFKLADDQSDRTLYIKGYQPIQFTGRLPEVGIVVVEKAKTYNILSSDEPGYLLFFKSSETVKDSIVFITLDSDFLGMVAENTPILAGSYLQAYPYNPPRWESYLYEISNLKGDRNIRIFPFGLTPKKAKLTLSVPFDQAESNLPGWMDEINFKIAKTTQVTVGRVIAPLQNANLEQAGYFAFDILMIPNVSFFTSTLLRYILLLILIYFLANLLVIRRMVKFGSEINQMIVQKFNQLRKGIREISTGNLDYKVKLEGKDEFVELAERFNQMGDKLKDSIAEARDNERMKHELTIARQVQLSLLPRTLPDIPGFQIAATLKTANEVGGDFYDILPLNKDQYLFTVGDVSGKSTSAAFYMAQFISLIRYSPQFTDNPHEIVLRLNKYFSDPMVDRQIFITAIVGVLEVSKNKMQFVRAGHTLPIFMPGNLSEEMRELEKSGLGIGLERIGQVFEDNLEEDSLRLQSGDTIVFYTDGLVEAVRANGDQEEMQFYGEERLMSLLKDLRGQDASNIMQALTDDIESFYGGISPVDDYTMLIIQKTGK